jgi:phosphomannomutase
MARVLMATRTAVCSSMRHAEIIRCDLLTALLAGEYLRDNPGATIVYDLRSSRIVAETVRKLGGKPKRERVGHVFMKRTMAENEAVFGGELSGHFYFRDYFYCDSGHADLYRGSESTDANGIKRSAR